MFVLYGTSGPEMNIIIRYFLFALCLAGISRVSGEPEAISCDSPETVIEGDDAFITCQYHRNLEQEKQGFYVYRFQEGNKDHVILVLCEWEDSSLSCDLQPGYSVSSSDYTVTLGITGVRQEHDGLYICSTLPPQENVGTQTCNLTVKPKANAATDVSCYPELRIQPPGKTTVVCKFPTSLNASHFVLEKWPENHGIQQKEEIVRCTRGQEDFVDTVDGHQISYNYDTGSQSKVLKVEVEDGGLYVCKAEFVNGGTEPCTVHVGKVAVAESSTSSDAAIQVLTTPMYAILGCVIVLMILGLFFLLSRFKPWRTLSNHTWEKERAPLQPC